MSGLQERKPPNDVPTNIEGAIDHLIAQLPLKDKTRIAKMNRFDLSPLHRTMAPSIRDEFGLLKGNRGLLESCRKLNGQDMIHMDAVPAMIIDLLWANLRRTYSVRVVK